MTQVKATQLTRKFIRPLTLLAAASLALTTASAAVTWKNIQFGGFLSQGYLKSDANNYPIDTKDGTFDFREEAVNASTTFGSHLRVSAQIYAEKLGKYGNDKPMLDWAIVDYNFRQEFGVQVGRLKYPRSLYSDVLDLDVVRPFVLLPQPVYDSRLRDFQSSFDGALIYGNVGAGAAGSFDYKVYYGDIPMKPDTGVADYANDSGLYANPPGVTSVGIDSVRGSSVTWNTPVNGLRFGLSYSCMSHLKMIGPFSGAPSFSANIDVTKFEYEVASAEYTNGPWTFASEYQLKKMASVLSLPSFIAPPSTGKIKIRSYYISAARRLGTKFEVGAYYSEERDMLAVIDSAATHRRDCAVAVRYSFNDHLLFKLEVHSINGTYVIFNTPGISNPPGSLKNSMMLFAAKTTLSF